MKWNIQSETIPKTYDDILEILLGNRNIVDSKTFLIPKSPEKLTLKDVNIIQKQMDLAIERIKVAIKKQESVVVFGDYDVDGVCSTAILWESLRSLGFLAHPFIPDRRKHGYGLSRAALDEIILEHNPSLIITVDNGIVAHKEVDYLIENGIDIIISDHHSPEKKLPNATAVVHTTDLCGATVAWMISAQLDKKTALRQLDLCALATIADQVPLLGANRSFAFHGIRALQTSDRPGMTALINSTDTKQSDINEETVGFLLAPKINAMARMDHALDALRLLCTGNRRSALSYAETLNTKNDLRKDLTKQQYMIAKEMVEEQSEESLLVVASAEFHDGIIGLLAGKLAEQFSKPSIVIAIDGNTAKGSARSISDINITHLLRKYEDLLLSVGGHPMAAGFSIETTKIEIFSRKIQKHAFSKIDPVLLDPELQVECILPWSLSSMKIMKTLNQLRPFGAGNPLPIFALEKGKVLETKELGRQKNHLKILLTKNASDIPMEILVWNAFSRKIVPEPGQLIQVCGVFSENVWNGKSKLQMTAIDIDLNPE